MAAPADLLRDVPFFSLLDDQEREVLASRLDEVAIPAGHTMFHVGSPGGALYVVLKGEVELFFFDPTGERVVVDVVHSGDFFGDLALIDSAPRPAHAASRADGTPRCSSRCAWSRYARRASRRALRARSPRRALRPRRRAMA